MDDQATIIAIGLTLWGDDWPRHLAAALETPIETVEEWRQGAAAPTGQVYLKLAHIAAMQGVALDDVLTDRNEASEGQ